MVIDLERLPLSGILDSNSFGRLCHARIPEVMHNVRRFLECLTGLEDLGRFPFHLHHHGTFEHNYEPGRRVVVFPSLRSRCEVSRPNIHFLPSMPARCLEKFGALHGWLLGICKLVAGYARRDSNDQNQDQLRVPMVP